VGAAMMSGIFTAEALAANFPAANAMHEALRA
jgi:hypothetical protein